MPMQPVAQWPIRTGPRLEVYVLEHALELREEISGFAGVSLKIVKIEPDGSWRERHYLVVEPGEDLDRQKRTKNDEGKVSQSKLRDLEARLSMPELGLLPGTEPKKSLGSSESQVSISYGPHVLVPGSGGRAPGLEAGNDPFAQLAEAMERAISTKDQ